MVLLEGPTLLPSDTTADVERDASDEEDRKKDDQTAHEISLEDREDEPAIESQDGDQNG